MPGRLKTSGLGRAVRLVATAALGALVALAAQAPMAQAQDKYPSKPIRIIVNFPPGGGADFTGRLIGERLSKALGQPVVIDNRAGAAGNVGIRAAAKTEPDGYNFLVTSSVFVGNPAVAKEHMYDPINDFEPIWDFGGSPNVIAANPGLGFKDLAGMLAHAKANPGKLTYSTPGIGTLSQLGMELISLQAGIKLIHVPYKGGGPATQAAVSGEADMTVANISSLISFVRSGQLVVLAQTETKRWFELPNIKTLEDFGIKDANYGTYFCLFAPARTPKPIIDRIVKELEIITKDPGIRERLLKGGIDADAGGGPEHLRAKVAKEVKMWQDVVKRIGYQVQ